MLGTIAKDANALYKLFEGKGGCDFSCIANGGQGLWEHDNTYFCQEQHL